MPRRTRIALTGFLSLVLLLVLAGAGVYAYAQYRYHQIHKISVTNLATTQGTLPPQNILLVGDNCRDCLNGKQSVQFGTAEEVGGGRADVSMILHLVPATHQVELFSIPRDTWMPIPGTTNAIRVDAALNTSPGELVQTIEDDLGIPINHYVELNFDSFQSTVSALGGLSMYFPDPVYDSYSGLDVPVAGCYALNGTQALQVVRARHLYYEVDGAWNYDGLGDISRIDRDHEFLRVLATSVLQKGIGDPLTLNSVLGDVTGDLQVDSRFSLGDMVSLARAFRSIDANDTPSNTMPVYLDPNTFYYSGYNYGDVVFPQEPQDIQMMQQMLGLTIPSIKAGTTVQVLNGSGNYNQAATVGSALGGLGLNVTSVGDTTVDSQPAETIVYYAPGFQAQAEAVTAHLAGNSIMGGRNLPAGVDLQVVTGTYLQVTAQAPAKSPTTSTSPRSSPTAAAPPTTAANPTPSQDVTPSTETLASWDPRGCTASMTAVPLKNAPIPKDLPAT